MKRVSLDDSACEKLLAEYGTPEHVRKHCRAVAKKAWSLSEGTLVDRELLRSAALLHDIARTSKDHAAVGAKFLAARGFNEIGEIIAVHHTLPFQYAESINEKSLLFLADKLVIEDQEVRLEERFLESAKKLNTPEALKQHELRFRQASWILELLTMKINRNLEGDY